MGGRPAMKRRTGPLVHVDSRLAEVAAQMSGITIGAYAKLLIDPCVACRRRLPIAIGDSVVPGIDRVDP